MSKTKETKKNSNCFEQELRRLCLKIDALPQEQRPHLLALADVIRDQHRKLVCHEHTRRTND